MAPDRRGRRGACQRRRPSQPPKPAEPAGAGAPGRVRSGRLSDRCGRRGGQHQHDPHLTLVGDSGSDGGGGQAAPQRRRAVPLRPYLEDDVETALGNLEFDGSLPRRNPAWGIRRLQEVAAEAARQGLMLSGRMTMPANNLSLIFHKA
ncbi:MAG: DUF938 domain-containing protein [Hyphomonadaceae bacterium]|nr:DUF938 domain-containing protein [Hyphomonadaceae bacterium]